MPGHRSRTHSVLIIILLATSLTAYAGESSTDRWDIEQPVPFDAGEATESYLATLSAEEREASDNYFEGGYWLQLWSLVLSLGIAWLLMARGWSVRMRNLAERVTRFKPVHTMAYLALYIPALFLLTFPFSLYRDFFREHSYGLSNQTSGAWFGEQITVLIVNLIMFGILAALIYGVIRRWPERWWIGGAAVFVAFLIVGQLLAPVYILPLFNEYTPLEEGPVKEAILQLARDNGVSVDQVYQYDASKQSNRFSAHVSGFAGTMRISLSDNALKRGKLGDIKAVMAHELGHYTLNHPMKGVVQLGLVLVAGFAFLSHGFRFVWRRWGTTWGVRDAGDIAGLPIFVALFALYLFLATPVINTIIRTSEAEADMFALDASREPDGRARTAMMHAEDRKVDPGRIEEWLFFDHPSARSRVSMAMQWKEENQ